MVAPGHPLADESDVDLHRLSSEVFVDFRDPPTRVEHLISLRPSPAAAAFLNALDIPADRSSEGRRHDRPGYEGWAPGEAPFSVSAGWRGA
ncbi:hypothetical protein Misp01_75490 [Microtetraspora sp. NBRC 13810]|nr:hypothetical protein Misp01_75490 [Microtetraspora sp. NBRC 13810]